MVGSLTLLLYGVPGKDPDVNPLMNGSPMFELDGR